MKIILYCQHVWGVGHFFRTLEICSALSKHEIILVTGGSSVKRTLPDHVREIQLPAIMTDRNYSRLYTTEKGKTYQQVIKQRQRLLLECFQQEVPDLFIVELYPFGRKAFRFELDPILEGNRNGSLPPFRVVCSLRDILVEKKDPDAYETRVIKILNRYLDAVLVHADPGLVKLDETFSSMDEIKIPVVYTGFVAPKPTPGSGPKLRRQFAIGEDEMLVVASAGGGKVGATLLEPVIRAFRMLPAEISHHLHVFTGPFMNAVDFRRLKSLSGKRVKVFRFTPDFMAYLDTANLSLSMGGYNTSMNILTTGVPALVLPFSQDQEQGIRAKRLEKLGILKVLTDDDLDPSRLCDLMQQRLNRRPPSPVPVDLDGAAKSARWLEHCLLSS